MHPIPSILPRDFVANVAPDQVEYRRVGASGTQVVQVFLQCPTPRVCAFVLRYERETAHQVPMSLFLDEIQGFCADALERIGRERERSPASTKPTELPG